MTTASMSTDSTLGASRLRSSRHASHRHEASAESSLTACHSCAPSSRRPLSSASVAARRSASSPKTRAIAERTVSSLWLTSASRSISSSRSDAPPSPDPPTAPLTWWCRCSRQYLPTSLETPSAARWASSAESVRRQSSRRCSASSLVLRYPSTSPCTCTPASIEPCTSEWRSSSESHASVLVSAADGSAADGSAARARLSRSATTAARIDGWSASKSSVGSSPLAGKTTSVWKKATTACFLCERSRRSDEPITRSSTVSAPGPKLPGSRRPKLPPSAVASVDAQLCSSCAPFSSRSISGSLVVQSAPCSRMMPPATERASGSRPHSSTTSMAAGGGSLSTPSATLPARSSRSTASSAGIASHCSSLPTTTPAPPRPSPCSSCRMRVVTSSAAEPTLSCCTYMLFSYLTYMSFLVC